MMKRTAFRQGSALLIVLGMVAFMVVSAVGFSVFMRESRKPSSHLRRNITARLLLRAALANAIARVDGDFNPDEGRVEGVYDDFYPGVGPAQAKPIEENGDYWDKRVFMPFGPVDPRYTVSTLTLESLAYLPPAIINEVRVWSRLTRTAEWKNLSYDLGRYAFCAVDVSDCFDINKVRANERRTSASNHRFNLSSLYPDNAQQLDTVLDKVVNQDPASFISLADFNVVAGRGCPFAPWMNYIGMGDGQIYTRDEYETVSNALFITDTWFPPTNSVGRAAVKTYNLEGGGRNQPWTSFSDTATIEEEVLDGAETGTIGDPLFKVLQGVGMVCLYDYLDQDQVPISYTMPCTETAPMVCAVSIDNPQVKMTFKETVQAEGDYGTPVMQNGRQVYPYRVTVKRCSLAVDVAALGANGVVAFPFKRADLKSDYQKNFSGDALFRVFFGPENLKSRLSANGNGDEFVHPRRGRKWDAEPTGWRNGVYTAYGARAMGELNFTKPIKTQVEALGDFNVDADCPGGNGDLTLFYRVEMKGQLPGAKDDEWYSFDGMKGDANRFRPRNEDGVDLGMVNGSTWKGYLDDGGADAPASPADGVYIDASLPSGRGTQRTINVPAQRVHVAVWMRLFNGDDTYDVVPARPEDDEIYGNRDLPNPRAEWGDGVAGGDDVAPVLSFREGADNEVVFDYAAIQQKPYASAEAQLTFADAWNRLYVADPRYNFAPENWFAVNAQNGNMTKQDWLDAVTPLFGEDGRDRDIFMFTSDQEYLQSIGELAFLPRVGDAGTAGNQMNRHYIRNSYFHAKPFSDRIGANAAAVLGQLRQRRRDGRHLLAARGRHAPERRYALRNRCGQQRLPRQPVLAGRAHHCGGGGGYALRLLRRQHQRTQFALLPAGEGNAGRGKELCLHQHPPDEPGLHPQLLAPCRRDEAGVRRRRAERGRADRQEHELAGHLRQEPQVGERQHRRRPARHLRHRPRRAAPRRRPQVPARLLARVLPEPPAAVPPLPPRGAAYRRRHGLRLARRHAARREGSGASLARPGAAVARSLGADAPGKYSESWSVARNDGGFRPPPHPRPLLPPHRLKRGENEKGVHPD